MRHKTTNCHFETFQNQAQNGTCWSTQRQTSTRSLRNTTCLFETSQNQTKNVTFSTTSLLLTTVNQFYATPHPRHDNKFSTCDIKPPFLSLTHPKTEPKTRLFGPTVTTESLGTDAPRLPNPSHNWRTHFRQDILESHKEIAKPCVIAYLVQRQKNACCVAPCHRNNRLARPGPGGGSVKTSRKSWKISLLPSVNRKPDQRITANCV